MWKLKVSNEKIIRFRQVADGIITTLSKANKRSRYLSAIQRMYDALEVPMKSIEKKQKAIQEKYARVDSDTNSFILGPQGQFTFTKDNQEALVKALEEYHESTRELSLDIPQVYLSKDDLPKDGTGNMNISNHLLKELCPFIIKPELRDDILYSIPGEEQPQETPQLKAVSE